MSCGRMLATLVTSLQAYVDGKQSFDGAGTRILCFVSVSSCVDGHGV